MKAPSILQPITTLLVASVLWLSACQKNVSGDTGSNTPAGKQNVLVYLNDDPAQYAKVLIDIASVEIKTDTGHQHHDDDFYDDDNDGDDDHHGHDSYGTWDTLGINPGIYDLLRLRNGADTLLANGFTLAGRVTKIRIKLGGNSSIWTDSTHQYPLSACDNKSYIYVKLTSNSFDTLPGGGVRIRLDFDVAKSIKRSNGGYCLQPVLKAWCYQNTGSVEGKIRPAQANALITLFNNTDTAYAIPNRDGEFKIRGINPGVYSLLVDATAPYQDTTLNNIQVRRNDDTRIPNIQLHQ